MAGLTYNDLGLCNADPTVDVSLTETGKEQAEKLAEAFKHTTFGCIYISELKRTQQTAEYINHYHHVESRIDKRLNDNRTGYEGRPADEHYAALAASPDRWTVRFNDGESWDGRTLRSAYKTF